MKSKLLFLFSFIICAVTVNADNVINVKINIIDTNSAEMSLTYPTPYQESVMTVLPSQLEDLSGLSGTYKLLSAVNQSGEKREFTDYQDGLSDAVVQTKTTDTAITVKYKLTNGLKMNDIAMFRYPLILGSNFPRQANITITYPSKISLLAYPGSQDVKVIPKNSVKAFISMPTNISDYYSAPLVILAQKKVGAYVQKNVGTRFVLTAPKSKTADATQLLNSINAVVPEYKKLLGADLPRTVVVAVVPMTDKIKQYESAAVQISKNIILLDNSMFTKDTPVLFRKKVFAHELVHVVMDNMQLFRNEPYFARWLDEGVSSFVEQYLSDMYFDKGIDPEDLPRLSGGYMKLTREEAKYDYRNYFDYGFSAEENFEDIHDTYRHSGLIFYNLYARDKTIIPRLLTALKGTLTGGNCETCDTDHIIELITSMNGLTKDQIIYPFDEEMKISMTFQSPIADIIFRKK